MQTQSSKNAGRFAKVIKLFNRTQKHREQQGGVWIKTWGNAWTQIKPPLLTESFVRRLKLNRPTRIEDWRQHQMPSDTSLIHGVLRNLKRTNKNKKAPTPRWAVVTDTFAIGSTSARKLCEQFDLDPDELI